MARSPQAEPERVARAVPTCAADVSVGGLLDRMRGRRYESVSAVAVLAPDGRPLGLAPLTDVLAADPDSLVAELIEAAPVADHAPASIETAVHRMLADGSPAVAVVDRHGAFEGLLATDRMLGLLIDAHHEDLARLGGFMHGTDRARRAAEERVLMRIWHRLPWLLLGLLGAMLSVKLVAGFERQLDETVLIAFFLPAIVYMADAVGTQTEALMIRALSVGALWRRVIRRELWSGALIGALVGAAFIPFAAIGWGDGELAVAIGISLFAACSVATAIAMALPLLLQRLGLDPAFGSGPLATVIQDLISIAIYLGATAAVVG